MHFYIEKRLLLPNIIFKLICSMFLRNLVTISLLVLGAGVAPLFLSAQKTTLSGIITDRQSDEPIPFVSIAFNNRSNGTLTDSAGKFTVSFMRNPNDTLVVTSVGYKPLRLAVGNFKDSLFLSIKMDIAPVGNDAVVKVKYDRALWLWKRIIANKKQHDLGNYENYSYEVYNKLELDVNNVDKEKLADKKIFKSFNFIFDNIDTTETKPFLPVFLTETLSDFFYQQSPHKTREVIKASNTSGIKNESVTKLLGATYQNVNVYRNQVPVFDLQFTSPFHDNGNNYYRFKLLDTQYLGNKRLVHLGFTPKRQGENTFDGDCWIVDSSYAIQKVTLRPSGNANINFVQNLTLIQEYRLIDDTTWFLSKDKFVADISPLGKSRTGFKGRKTSTYRQVVLNSKATINALALNKKPEEVVVLPTSEEKSRTYWDTGRHDELTKNERAIYKMIDTIQSMPNYKKYLNAANFLGTGYYNIGKYQIGPWFSWVSGNAWEGTRIRFDLGTNGKFSKKIYLHSYLAYGFLDKKMKGFGEMFYLPKKNPRFYLYGSYSNDLDWGQHYYDQTTSDNILTFAIRKQGVPRKFQRLIEKRFEIYQETNKAISFLLEVSSKQYQPLLNLPEKALFNANINGEALNNFETSFRIRYAYLEKFLENNFFRTSLGSERPIIQLRYSKGWAGVLKSSYSYHKISAGLSDYVNTPPFGYVYYNLFAGKIYGTLPYPLLEIHPGNEMYYYNKYAFNMMNRFEYISDQYAGFNLEHNVGNGLFKFIPLTRKLKFRQFYAAKGVIGSLSNANQALNFVGVQSFKSLNKKMYLELGTGVDNIFKFLRIDFVWRVLPTPAVNEDVKRFGVFGSFKLSF